jgi:3D-(3,5/4)-trihydroxycyclohexane-1,2-dione acylhydrolase (decyclizing)
LHKLWRCPEAGAYHVEYGYSCMGYEIAGGLGVKLAMPDREVWVLLGDGSYLMMNSEIATSVMLDKKLNIVVLDNGGFGCIDRLQRSCSPAMPRASARYRARWRALPNSRERCRRHVPSVALQ